MSVCHVQHTDQTCRQRVCLKTEVLENDEPYKDFRALWHMS